MLTINQKLNIKEQIYTVKKSLPRERFLIKLFNPSGEFSPVLKDNSVFELSSELLVVTKTLSKGEFYVRVLKSDEKERFKEKIKAMEERERRQREREREREKERDRELEAVKEKLEKEEIKETETVVE